jgi:preprotein translocase subunit SecD
MKAKAKHNERRHKRTPSKPNETPTKSNGTRITKSVSRAPNMPCTTLASVRKQIEETEQTIGSLKGLLHEAMHDLRTNGDEVTVLVTDGNGKRIEKQRANPALKRMRELAANLRSLSRYRNDLLEEVAAAKKATTVEQSIDALDKMLEEEEETETKPVDSIDALLNEGE